MRHYKPVYAARYRPMPAGEPARPQIGLAPLVPDHTPPVVPASELYGRPAKSVRALFADSRVSGACLMTQFQADGSKVRTVVPPKSPYYAIRLHPEQVQTARAATGLEPAPFTAPMFCGVQAGDVGLSAAEYFELRCTGVLAGFEDEAGATVAGATGEMLRRLGIGVA